MDAKSEGSKSGSEVGAARAAHGKHVGKSKTSADEMSARMPGSRMLLAGLAILAVCGLAIILMAAPKARGPGDGWTDTGDGTDEYMKRFTSASDLSAFIKYSAESSGGYGGYGYYRDGMVMAGNTAATTGAIPMAAPQAGIAESSKGAGADDYSSTNVQVEGVDEADLVKNDGKYIYVLSGNKITIIDAYPAEDAEKLSEISFGGEERPTDIYINKDRLVVFVQKYESYDYPVYETGMKMAAPGMPSIRPYRGSGSKTLIKVYDVSDREDPELEKTIKVDGDYFESRMIGDYVYAVINEPIRYSPCTYRAGEFDLDCLAQDITVPTVSVDGDAMDSGGFPDVYYWDIPDYNYRFTTVVSVNTQVDEKPGKKYFVMGSAQDMFVSLDNIFVTRTKWMSQQEMQEQVYEEVVIPNLPAGVKNELDEIDASDKSEYVKKFEKLVIVKEYVANLDQGEQQELQDKIQDEYDDLQEEFARNMEQTVISKIGVSEGRISPKGTGVVPGTVLNQFSMDEYDGYFRIATTSGHVSREGGGSTNNVYVLDREMEVVGELEDLAPGEKIYSARFMGKRCYLVTFKKVDPLFVIDLSDPTNPEVLGKLKIPGYSDYLHPYDENHLIGLGKGAVAAEEGDFAWYQGVKLSLFDVSDVEKPKEIAKYEIGDRGTDSPALSDHKAFLFDKGKNLLVIPVLLAEIDEEQYPGGVEANTYGEYVWQGAYVFDITLDGFELRGRVSHVDDESVFKKSGYYYSSPYSVKRSLYMDDVLYTVSERKVQMNDLDDASYINEVKLPYEEDRRYYYDDVMI